MRTQTLKLAKAMLALVFLAVCARADEPAADNAPLQLKPAALADSSGIFLDQIVTPTPARAVIPHIRLAPAPSLGQTASFSRKQISDLVQLRGEELIATNWSGASHVTVSRRTRSFADTELSEMLTALLQKEFVKDKGELEIRIGHPFEKMLVPDEPLKLKVNDLPSSGLSVNFLANCQLWCGAELVAEWPIHATASVWRDVPVARSAITRGCLLKDADISMERRDLLTHREYFLNYPSTDENLEITDALQPGMPLLSHQVRQRPTILRGRVVEGVYVDGALSISLKVETLEDGTPGQIVRVRNPKTRRELYGKVENEQTVLISL